MDKAASLRLKGSKLVISTVTYSKRKSPIITCDTIHLWHVMLPFGPFSSMVGVAHAALWFSVIAQIISPIFVVVGNLMHQVEFNMRSNTLLRVRVIFFPHFSLDCKCMVLPLRLVFHVNQLKYGICILYVCIIHAYIIHCIHDIMQWILIWWHLRNFN